MPKFTQRLSAVLIASLVVLAVAFFFSATGAHDNGGSNSSGPWHMVRVDSTHGHAYLYNNVTGETWQLEGRHRTRVAERKQGD